MAKVKGKHYQSWQDKPKHDKANSRNGVNHALGIHLDKLRNSSSARASKIAALNQAISAGGEAALAAAKAKRSMQDSWVKRVGRNVDQFWNPNGKRLVNCNGAKGM